MHQKGTLHLDAMHQKGILHPDAMHQKGALHLDAMHQKGALHLDAMHQNGALHLDAMHQNGTLHLDAITIAPVITMLLVPDSQCPGISHLVQHLPKLFPTRASYPHYIGPIIRAVF